MEVHKAELLQEGIFFLIHLFARDVLLIKKLEIEKTKPTFIISVLKVEYPAYIKPNTEKLPPGKVFVLVYCAFSNKVICRQSVALM